jgi:hypothetical protein
MHKSYQQAIQQTEFTFADLNNKCTTRYYTDGPLTCFSSLHTTFGNDNFSSYQYVFW